MLRTRKRNGKFLYIEKKGSEEEKRLKKRNSSFQESVYGEQRLRAKGVEGGLS